MPYKRLKRVALPLTPTATIGVRRCKEKVYTRDLFKRD